MITLGELDRLYKSRANCNTKNTIVAVTFSTYNTEKRISSNKKQVKRKNYEYRRELAHTNSDASMWQTLANICLDQLWQNPTQRCKCQQILYLLWQVLKLHVKMSYHTWRKMPVFVSFIHFSTLPFNTWCPQQGHAYLNKPADFSFRFV